jgi:hypothetical protein
VRADTFGEGLHRRRAGHELIGDAQGRGGIQGLGDPEPAEEFDHPHGRWEFVSLHGSPFDGGPSHPGSRDPPRTAHGSYTYIIARSMRHQPHPP